MIGLLTGTVLLLMGIAIWQINKIYQLIQNNLSGKKDDSQIANEKDNDIQGKLMFAFLVFIYVCLLYTSPSPRDATLSRMPSSA